MRLQAAALVAMLVSACTEPTPPAPRHAPEPVRLPLRERADREDTSAPLAGARKTVVVDGVGFVSPLHVDATHLYFIDRKEVAPFTYRLMRAELAAFSERQELWRSKNYSFVGAGAMLVVLTGEPLAWVVPKRGGPARRLGAYIDAVWDGRRLFAVRTTDSGFAVDAFVLNGSLVAKTVAIIDDAALEGTISGLTADDEDVWLALDERTDAARIPTRVYRVSKSGAGAQQVASVNDVHSLDVAFGHLLIGSLARAHRYERASDSLHQLDGISFDSIAIDGKIAYFSRATLLPAGGYGGLIYEWRPPDAPRMIDDYVPNPGPIAVSPEHVYVLDNVRGAIVRIRR